MAGNNLRDRVRSYSFRDWAQILFMTLICLAGGYLIIYSVYMMTVNHDTSFFMFALVMFGVGCTSIWFGLSHIEIQHSEEKLDSITRRLDSIIEKIGKE